LTSSIDYSAYGEVDVVPLTRIQKVAAGFLARNWTTIPHVTHHDEADSTALEAVRKELSCREPAVKLSPLAFIMKAAVVALQAHPRLNASLDASGTHLILKKYLNIGVAIDTPAGLLVGVVRDCDRKDVLQIATELEALSRKARAKGLTLEEMSGGSFTVSSLGGIGGTAFTPIINAPEVAILGVSKAQWKPTRGASDQIDWRLMLPLSLSYDHRAVNGADAARFMHSLTEALANPESVYLQTPIAASDLQ
jgi:pyruvate dehydrogenase E2 component (dihydrolipoamide acetyltransferase)